VLRRSTPFVLLLSLLSLGTAQGTQRDAMVYEASNPDSDFLIEPSYKLP
jgi:hypothetical protein